MRTFRFGGRWQLAAPVAEVATVLTDLAAYPSWWPEVRAVAAYGPGRARVLCRSRLPYTLDLVLTSVSEAPPRLETLVAGDLVGRVGWVLTAQADGTLLELDQEVSLRPGPLQVAASAVAPLLTWNHEQMMRSGIAGLRARLAAI